MYRVVLADDERIVLRGLQRSIDWKSLDCEVIAAVTDGNEAYKQILALQPDIVLIDIMMPGKTGLQIVRDLVNRVHCAFIIFSGYSEFDFVKEALRLETVDYLLKPINIEEIERTIQRAQKRVQERALLDRSQQAMGEAMAHRIQRLLDGSEEGIEEWNRFSAFSVINIQMIAKNARSNDVAVLLNEAQTSEQRLFMVHRKETLSAVCCVVRREDIGSLVCGVIGRLRQRQALRPDEFFWGIGETCYDQKGLAHSCTLAQRVLNYSLFIRQQASASVRLSGVPDPDYDRMIERITDALFKGDGELYLEEAIERLFEKMLDERLTVDAMRSLCCKLVYNCRYLAEHDYARALGGDQAAHLSASLVMEQKNVATLKRYLQDALGRMRDAALSTEYQTTSGILRRIYAYVENNISRSITLADIAAHVNMNASYISHIFKKETGTNLFDFITDQKMNHAKKLILNDAMLIGEVARAVGYADQRYFCQVFKKHTGMTAMEYRKTKQR